MPGGMEIEEVLVAEEEKEEEEEEEEEECSTGRLKVLWWIDVRRRLDPFRLSPKCARLGTLGRDDAVLAVEEGAGAGDGSGEGEGEGGEVGERAEGEAAAGEGVTDIEILRRGRGDARDRGEGVTTISGAGSTLDRAMGATFRGAVVTCWSTCDSSDSSDSSDPESECPQSKEFSESSVSKSESLPLSSLI